MKSANKNKMEKKKETKKEKKKEKNLVVALVHMPPYGIQMPPLGIACLAAKLKEDGHEAFAFDFNMDYFCSFPEKRQFIDYNKAFFWSDKKRFESANLINDKILDKWADAIIQKNPSLVGFSVTDHSCIVANALSDTLKRKSPKLLIIYGGPFCSGQSLQFRETTDSVDAYVVGEGEMILSEIASSVKKTGKIAPAKGILFKKNGKITDCGVREPCDINALPIPDFSVLPMDKYTRKDVMPILMSRGCNFHCAFCSDYVNWNHHRMRSPESIISEIERDIAIYGVHEFHCNDLAFDGDLNALEALADEIIRRDLKIRWFGQGRIRKDMSPELFKKLRKAGLYRITLGMESASQNVLNQMRKGYLIKDAEKFISDSKKAGIITMTMWMVGFPGETWLDFFKTISFIIRNRRNIDSISSLTKCNVHLESDLFINMEKYGINFDNDGNWYNKNLDIRTREKRERIFRAIVPLFVPFRENQ